MGAFTGGMTVKRFRTKPVEDTLAERLRFLGAIQAEAAQALPPDGDAERHVGWVAPERMLDTDFNTDKVFYNDHLVLSVRIETRVPPAALVRAKVQERTRAMVAERGRDNLTRQEAAEVKELVRRELRRQMLPAYKVVDLVWHLVGGRVWVWTHSPKVLDEIEEKFVRTFGKPLTPEDPYSAAERILLAQSAVDGHALLTVMPASFAAQQ